MEQNEEVLEIQTYLAVPYEQKGKVSESVGKLSNGRNAVGYDPDKNLWYAKAGALLSKVEPWLPNPNLFTQPTHQDPTLEFAAVLDSAGLVLNELPIFDGKVHRVKTMDDKSGQKSGAYAAYGDGNPNAWYQDHRNHPETQHWHASYQQTDPLAKLHIKAQQANQRNLREITESKRYQHYAHRCDQAFQLMPPAKSDQAYLKRKGVQAFPNVCQDKKGRLVVPLMDEHHRIHSLQRINGNGFKSLKKGAQKSGHFFVVGVKPITNGEPILYAEGYSTAASIAEATGRSVVMTVDAGNMPKVAAKLKQQYPENQHLFLADDDRKNKVNKGLDKAREAAEITNGHWLSPRFISDQIDYGMTDFNDLHVSSGAKVVNKQIEEFIERCWPELKHVKSEQLTPELNSIENLSLNLSIPLDNNQQTEPSNQPPLKNNEASLPIQNSNAENDVSGLTSTEASSTNAGTPTKASQPKSVFPNHLTQNYFALKNKYYFNSRPQTLAFIDKGNKLQTRMTQTKVVSDLIAIATSRRWTEIKLTGCKEFKREAWYHAKLQGMNVKNYRPDERDIQRLAQHQTSVGKSLTQPQTSNEQQTQLNQIEALKAAKDFSVNLNPQAQERFISKVKHWLKEQLPKLTNTPPQASLTVNTTPEYKIIHIKEQHHDHELER